MTVLHDLELKELFGREEKKREKKIKLGKVSKNNNWCIMWCDKLICRGGDKKNEKRKK